MHSAILLENIPTMYIVLSYVISNLLTTKVEFLQQGNLFVGNLCRITLDCVKVMATLLLDDKNLIIDHSHQDSPLPQTYQRITIIYSITVRAQISVFVCVVVSLLKCKFINVLKKIQFFILDISKQ